MKISVVIPVFNTKNYLNHCITSILNQSFHDFEILLVDDGSTDGSAQICDILSKKHPEIQVIHKKNGGASSARNIGIQYAKGDYIHFIDSDDFLNGNDIYEYLSKNVLTLHPEIVFARLADIPDKSVEIKKEQAPYDFCGSFSGNILLHILKNSYELTLTSPVNKLFNRQFLIDNNLFFTEGIQHEEDEWLPRVVFNAKKVWFDNKIIYFATSDRKGSLSEIPNDKILAKKAISKIYISYSGMQYMISQKIDFETAQYVAQYYWGYLIDAMIAINKIKLKEEKKYIIKEMKQHRKDFDYYKLLKSKNQRMMGWFLSHLGVKFTVKLVSLRYGSSS